MYYISELKERPGPNNKKRAVEPNKEERTVSCK
jgi:hypothetical protein